MTTPRLARRNDFGWRSHTSHLPILHAIAFAAAGIIVYPEIALVEVASQLEEKSSDRKWEVYRVPNAFLVVVLLERVVLSDRFLSFELPETIVGNYDRSFRICPTLQRSAHANVQ